MDLANLPIKKTALNPLWIITIFFSFTETILGLAVYKTQDTIQIILTVFVILFPTFVSIMFFIILWNRPLHFYAPTDYQNDRSFLHSFNKATTANNLSEQIEGTVNQALSSNKLLEELKTGKKTEDVLKETAKNIVDKIKQDNFVTVDISTFSNGRKEILTYAYDDFKTFGDFIDRVFFRISTVSDVRPFSYGYTWLLKDAKSNKIIKGARMFTGIAQGTPIKDLRTLEELGIHRGSELIADKP